MYVVWNHECKELIGVAFTQKGANKLRTKSINERAKALETSAECIESLNRYDVLKARWVF